MFEGFFRHCMLNKKISSHGTSYFGDRNKHHHVQFEMLIILLFILTFMSSINLFIFFLLHVNIGCRI